MNAPRDSMGCTWADLHGREFDEEVSDAIAALSFAEKRELWRDWRWACTTWVPHRPRTRLNFREWVAVIVARELTK